MKNALVNDLNWKSLIFGVYDITTVKLAVSNTYWQQVRVSMLGATPLAKYLTLKSYVAGNLRPENGLTLSERREREIQVTNYVHALKRGGLVHA